MLAAAHVLVKAEFQAGFRRGEDRMYGCVKESLFLRSYSE